MKLPPMNALRAFECAARTGSFAAAGAEMGVSSAAVSVQVKNLEDWLRRQLFFRHANQIRLTDAGRDYYENAASALSEIASFTEALTEGDTRRPLVISATPALGQLWLPTVLSAFSQRYADIPVDLRLEAEDPDLEAHGIDARLSYGGELPDYHMTELFTDRLVPVSVDGAAPERCRRIEVNWGANITTVAGWTKWFQKAGVPAPLVMAQATASSVPAAVAMAEAGMGSALLPEQVIHRTLKTGRLKRCPGPDIPMQRAYVMVTAHYKSRSRRLQNLRDMLVEASTRVT